MKEYAPQYSKKQKIIRVVIAGVFCILAGVLFKLEGEPLLQAVAKAPECYEVFGMSGLELLVHILFFWVPLSVFLLAAVLMLPLGVRGLIEGQFPPKGVKVFIPQRFNAASSVRSNPLFISCSPYCALALSCGVMVKLNP